MPLSGGRAERSLVQASRPPAEAPIPTTGKSPALWGTSGANLSSPLECDGSIWPETAGFSV